MIRDGWRHLFRAVQVEPYQWLRAVEGKEGALLYASQRGNAYFYYRMALKFKDTEAAVRYLREVNRLMPGKNSKERKQLIAAMIKRAHPLGMLTIRERGKFLKTLTPEEERSLDRAIAWWKETYEGGAARTRWAGSR